MCPRETQADGAVTHREHSYVNEVRSDVANRPDEQSGDFLYPERLVEKLRSVTVMNDQWQKYDAEREKHVKELCKKMERLKLICEELERKNTELKKDKEKFERKAKELQKIVKDFSPLYDELEEKNHRLQRRILELEEGHRILKNQLKKAGSTSERVEHLQHQLEVCVEDFKKEKSEKEYKQREVTDLTYRLMDAERLLRCYQQKVEDIKAIKFPSISSHTVSGNKPPFRPVQSTTQRNKFASNTFEWGGEFELPSDVAADGVNVNQDTISARPIADLSPSCWQKGATEVTVLPVGLDPEEGEGELVCH